MLKRKTVCLPAAVTLALLGGPAILAEEKRGWTDTAEFSLVATDGNSESTSLGFKNTTARKWDKSNVTFRAGGIRVETTKTTRTALNGVVSESRSTETTAENYYANGRYERNTTDSYFWFAGGGWDRNEPSGIKNRYVVEGGVGTVWRDTDDLKLKTNYGLTYTDQEDVVKDPTVDDTFLGARFAWDYLNKLGSNTTYTNVFIADLNLDETSDWRADMDNGLAVAMSEKLALKVGLRFVYDNEPSKALVPNFDGGGGPLPAVPFELDELDTILTVSLVVNFR